MDERRRRGGQPGNQNAAKDNSAEKLFFYGFAEDLDALQKLRKAGYEADRSKIIRRAIREAADRLDRAQQPGSEG